MIKLEPDLQRFFDTERARIAERDDPYNFGKDARRLEALYEEAVERVQKGLPVQIISVEIQLPF